MYDNIKSQFTALFHELIKNRKENRDEVDLQGKLWIC
jgi:hypothetical protein